MADYPDFHKIGISWTRRDWASREGEIKSWAFEKTTPLSPGSTAYGTLYTVPSGRRLYLTEVGFGGEYRGVYMFYVYGGAYLFNAVLEAYHTGMLSYSTPPIINAGEQFRDYSENHDIVAGKWHGFFLGFETPASIPEKPKNDDPEELYRTGEFNWANVYQMENDETLIIFGKYKHEIYNYLRVKHFGTPKQKRLAAFKMLKSEAGEIFETFKLDPKKIKLVLAKYEKKYKPKRWFNII